MMPDPFQTYLLHQEQVQELWDRAELLRLGEDTPPPPPAADDLDDLPF